MPWAWRLSAIERACLAWDAVFSYIATQVLSRISCRACSLWCVGVAQEFTLPLLRFAGISTLGPCHITLAYTKSNIGCSEQLETNDFRRLIFGPWFKLWSGAYIAIISEVFASICNRGRSSRSLASAELHRTFCQKQNSDNTRPHPSHGTCVDYACTKSILAGTASRTGQHGGTVNRTNHHAGTVNRTNQHAGTVNRTGQHGAREAPGQFKGTSTRLQPSACTWTWVTLIGVSIGDLGTSLTSYMCLRY